MVPPFMAVMEKNRLEDGMRAELEGLFTSSLSH